MDESLDNKDDDSSRIEIMIMDELLEADKFLSEYGGSQKGEPIRHSETKKVNKKKKKTITAKDKYIDKMVNTLVTNAWQKASPALKTPEPPLDEIDNFERDVNALFEEWENL